MNIEILMEVCVVRCDHDKGDGKDEEDPDGGHHGRDAPPRPSANPSKSPLECSLRTFETHPRCCQVDALVATSSSSSGPVDQSRGSRGKPTVTENAPHTQAWEIYTSEKSKFGSLMVINCLAGCLEATRL